MLRSDDFLAIIFRIQLKIEFKMQLNNCQIDIVTPLL